MTSRAETAALALVVCILTAACAAPTGGAGAELRIAVRRPSSLDPVNLRDASGILIARQIFAPLASYNQQTAALRPGVASWETADGGARFVFRFSGARFSSGRKVTADDAGFALNRLARKGTGSEAAFLVDSVAGFAKVNVTGEAADMEGVKVLDENTLEIRLSAPWFDFPYALTHPSTAPVPRAELESDPGAFVSKPFGAGHFRLAGGGVTGEDIEISSVGAPTRVRNARFLVYERAEDAWRDFESGRLDIAEAPPGKVATARAKYGGEGFAAAPAAIYLGFNLHNPKLADVRLRRAISLAIDRARLAHEVYGDALLPANNLVPTGIAGRSESACAGMCTRDIQLARSLLREAFPQGPPVVAYDYPAEGIDEQVARAIESDLAEVGIVVERRPRATDLTSFFDLISSGGHEMFRLVWPAEYPLGDWFLNPLFRSGAPDNHAGYAVPEVDEMLSKARSDPSLGARLAIYRSIERRVLSDMPVVPVGFFRSRYVASPVVRGFYVDPLGAFDISLLSR